MENSSAQELHFTRRTVTTALLSVLSGCAMQSSPSPHQKLEASRIAFSGPRYDPDLEIKVSAGAAGASASAVHDTKGILNQCLAGWADVVVPGFTNAFTTALAKGGVAVEQSDWGAPLIPSVRCFLTAGLVYKTYTSSAYAPFVHVVLELGAPGGRIVYHQLTVATNRPFNMFMTSIPAKTPYLLENLSMLNDDPKPALDALQALAAQLGEKFAADMLARITHSAFLGAVPHEV
jgi:hypothetical protein